MNFFYKYRSEEYIKHFYEQPKESSHVGRKKSEIIRQFW